MDELNGKLTLIEDNLSGSIDTSDAVMKGSLRFDENDAGGVLSNTFLRGYSAYEVWLAQGNEGTEEDFLASLKAEFDNADVDYNLIGNKPSINGQVLEGDVEIKVSDDSIREMTEEEIDIILQS